MLGHYQLFSDSDAPKFRVSRCVNMTFVPHMHHQYEFVYMLDGEMETTIENETRLLHPAVGWKSISMTGSRQLWE